MDRRSWLWRRKSSEKSPAETESSGSISSHSERFSDEQAYPNHSIQSPEVTSKAAPNDEEMNDSVKSLTEKLAAALLNISAKEDLVKQHAKVAEEAVSGWEKAENDMLSLKQQLEAATQKNSALEDRIGHLDGALKECVRQIRQVREEQEEKIHEVIAKRTLEWESMKSELESQLVELQVQLQSAKAEVVASMEKDTDLRPKLEALKEENSALKLELFSRTEELEIRIIERDLSTQAAETASKQHLESIKKVAKLEAECRKLKVVARKASPANDNKSFTASSVYVESFTDSQSDSGERLMAVETDMRTMSGLQPNECKPVHSNSWASTLVMELDQFKTEKAPGKNLMVASGEINLMDDFLEMERLAALPETESGSSCHEAGAVPYQSHGEESSLKAELEAVTYRAAELEEKLEKMEAEKVDVNMALTQCQKQLAISQSLLKEAELKLLELQTQLALANKSKRASDEELQATNAKREMAESQLRNVEVGKKTLLSKVGLLEEEIEKERALSAVTVAKYRKLEELLSIKHDAELQTAELEEKLEKMEAEKVEMNMDLTECLKQLEISQSRLKEAELKLLELQTQLALANESKQAFEEEVQATNAKRDMAESQLRNVEIGIETLLSKVGLLEDEMERERALSAESVAKCRKLEDELFRIKHDAELRHAVMSNDELKITQEKELQVAAGKLAECQQTIASLGRQLKSLATLDDFLIDSEKPLDLNGEGSLCLREGGEPWKLHSSDLYLPILQK